MKQTPLNDIDEERLLLYSELITNTGVGFLLFDKNFNVVDHNAKALEYLGLNEEMFKSGNYKKDFLFPLEQSCEVIYENIEKVLSTECEVVRCLKNKKNLKKILYGIKSAKDVRWLSISVFSVKNKNNEINMGMLLFDDSKLFMTTFELNRYKWALDSSAIVSVANKFGKITYVNDFFCKISGYSRQELEGQNHRILNSGFHPKDFFNMMWKTISSGNVWRGEIKNKTKQNTFYWVQSIIVPLLDKHGSIDEYISIRFDITDKKATEEKLIYSAKMNSLGEMAGSIAHEINNPLSLISIHCTQMINKLQSNNLDVENTTQKLNEVLKISDRIAKIIRGLKAFSRNDLGFSKQNHKLQEIVEDALNLCSEKFKNCGIEVKVHLPENFVILCNQTQIGQVFVNLLLNAFDAIKNNKEKWIEITAEIVGNKVEICFSDSGVGVPAEIQEKIMEPFFTTKEIGKGTGLGLSISEGFIESHGGSLFYDPTKPHTTFVIELPITQSINLQVHKT